MTRALIGFSGFVGGTLLKQTAFDSLYRSTNISGIRNQVFDTVVCAGTPAQKWIAIRDPKSDREKIDGLIAHLKTIRGRDFVLISTVDVFKNPIVVDESSSVDEVGLHAYGLHRRLLEKFVQDRFSKALIVRMPGLVGPGLRKNVIYDLLNNNNLDAINYQSVFQFYPMVNLWSDIRTALNAGLDLIHLTAEPISVADIAEQGFGKTSRPSPDKTPVMYDMRTRHAAVFGGKGFYQYSRQETMLAVRYYAQSEPHTTKSARGESL